MISRKEQIEWIETMIVTPQDTMMRRAILATLRSLAAAESGMPPYAEIITCTVKIDGADEDVPHVHAYDYDALRTYASRRDAEQPAQNAAPLSHGQDEPPCVIVLRDLAKRGGDPAINNPAFVAATVAHIDKLNVRIAALTEERDSLRRKVEQDSITARRHFAQVEKMKKDHIRAKEELVAPMRQNLINQGIVIEEQTIRAEKAEAEVAKLKYYRDAWNEFRSIQTGDAVGTIAKVEQYFRERDLSADANPVAWRYKSTYGDGIGWWFSSEKPEDRFKAEPLYERASPQPSEPTEEIRKRIESIMAEYEVELYSESENTKRQFIADMLLAQAAK
jgi:hypothetical protein